MKKSILYLTMALALFSCRPARQASEQQASTFDRLVATAYAYPDDRTLEIVDSLVTTRDITEPMADFARGIVNDSQLHTVAAERFYKKSYEALDPERDGWHVYLRVASQLSQIRMTTSDFKGSLEVATNAMKQAEEAGELTNEFKVTFLWSIALCQYTLHLSESEETSRQVLELMRKDAQEKGLEASVNEFIFMMVLIRHEMGEGNLEKADSLMIRTEELLRLCDIPENKDIVDEYRMHLKKERISLLEMQGKTAQADALFEETLPQFGSWPDGLSWAASYLLSKGRFAEAADLYKRVDQLLPDDSRGSVMNLDNIRFSLIPRLEANLGADRKAEVYAIAKSIADNYPEALENDRNGNAAELATIYDTQGKEMQIARQQAELSRQRLWGVLAAFGLITLFFIVYTINRRRAARRLAEVKAAKERIESELRIARDIQMSMVPGVFPEREGLDMFASMTPAKEVGGDLYGYVLQGENLYFCVGDVSGKGVPASLFMAQSARLFRTLAAEGLAPADIAVRMNSELSENNEKGMFVTMFIGMLHLDTGRLDYCNCGHNAPLLDGSFLPLKYENAPLGLWEDDPFEGETIADIRGRQLLVYTDGLNEAEDAELQQFGNKRLLEVVAGTRELNSHQVIDTVKETVERHRNGADPNDDLTLMCIKLS